MENLLFLGVPILKHIRVVNRNSIQNTSNGNGFISIISMDKSTGLKRVKREKVND